MDFGDDNQDNRLDVKLYSDASKSSDRDMGAVFRNRWIIGQWSKSFIKNKDPSIDFLELFALVIALVTWKDSPLLKNGRVTVHCDNQAAQGMVNSLASSCIQCRKLIRVLTLFQIQNNVRIFVKYIRSRDNILADSLSRLNFKKFWENAKDMNPRPDQLPQSLWPAEKSVGILGFY